MAKRVKKRITKKVVRGRRATQRRTGGQNSRGRVTRKARTAKHVYFFGGGKAEGNRDMRNSLGGKGAGLAEMTNAGLPVPPGFTISADVGGLYYARGGKVPGSLDKEILKHLMRLERLTGNKFGSTENPLLVSVRSGSRFSMPGMMDTILNLGLNDETVEGLKRKTQNGRFAADSYRRFIQMFSNVVLEVPKEAFAGVLERVKRDQRVRQDTELSERALRIVIDRYKRLVKRQTGNLFPQDPYDQLQMARDAVFRSWQNPRAIEYRRIYDIPGDVGTAVNVQLMVFGNTGNRSATGVGFTRNPATGQREFYGEFLVNAQGEDVVAGIRTPKPIAELEKLMPSAYRQLRTITSRLERHYRDVQEFEFTIQDEQLYMLQTRSGKRTGYAAVVIATDLVAEKRLSSKEALSLVDPESLTQLLVPIFDPKAWRALPTVTKGLPASPGAASGHAVFTSADAVLSARKGEPALLIRKETVPDDIHGMHAAQGVLTATGGLTSHAAVVGRQMGKPSVVGAGELEIDEGRGRVRVGGVEIIKGEYLSFDGLTGEVKCGQVATKPSEILQVLEGNLDGNHSDIFQRFERLLRWADAHRRLGVRANADLADQATIARAFGAEGIGLCRTEHMFFGEERLPVVQQMIMADNETDRRAALDELLPFQRDDFYDLFKVMEGQPVTIRLIDPPLHEFLPKREELMVDIAVAEARDEVDELIESKRQVLRRVEQLREFNPMLGHRGVRLGITYPEITEMQSRAIIEAACRLTKEGVKVIPEIMIPLVGDVRELRAQRAVVDRVAVKVMDAQKVKVRYLVGTMIEVPRSSVTANEIALEADFFSFGTNDLTQMGYGFSRDDAGRFLRIYQDLKLIDRDPFQSIDTVGIGDLVRIGVERGRQTRPNLKLGVCGEHGGDAASVHFFHEVGLDYVSASPFRIPVARLAAAQAALRDSA
ncbi:MAG TPA: pyruvate, phosphate dikinase [Acidobacteria bacterium]|nr:pyruvate, phosphate dikinase [Nitrospirales bacterium]HIN70047.1 pyruvate, phosphate dikinase [Acidobacteriota bacterium]